MWVKLNNVGLESVCMEGNQAEEKVGKEKTDSGYHGSR